MHHGVIVESGLVVPEIIDRKKCLQLFSIAVEICILFILYIVSFKSSNL